MNAKQLVDPPKPPRQGTADPGRPKTLTAALDKIDSLQIRTKQLEQAQPNAAVASPANPVSTPATPGRIQAAAPTRQGIVADRTADQSCQKNSCFQARQRRRF